jgi:hypothetical protein
MRSLIAALSAVVLLNLVGCGAKPVPTPPLVAPTSPEATAGIDDYHPADVKFFRRNRIGAGAIEADLQGTIKEAVQDSTAVVIAEVAGPGPARSFTGEVPSDVVQMTGYHLRIVEMLAGKLPAEHAKELVVEFLGEGPITNLPTGKAVWFLHRKGDPTRHLKSPPPVPAEERNFYRVISSQGLFLQGKESVIAPMSEQHAVQEKGVPAHPDAAVEGEGHKKLSELVTKIKSVA